jgi:hypothetical protein
MFARMAHLDIGHDRKPAAILPMRGEGRPAQR